MQISGFISTVNILGPPVDLALNISGPTKKKCRGIFRFSNFCGPTFHVEMENNALNFLRRCYIDAFKNVSLKWLI